MWAAGAGAYVLIARRLTEKRQLYLLGLGIAALLAAQQVLSARYHTVWSPLQIFGVTGADQAFVYGRKYVVITIGLLLVWLVWLRRLLKEGGWRGLHIPGQLLLLTGAGVVLIPSRIDFPQYAHALVYIADRMSLASGVLLCGVLAQVRVRRAEMFALAALTAVFFGFLYADGARANRKEDQIQEVVEQQMPRYARVVFLSSQWNLRVDPLTHVADRVCIGRCYSYADYEPSTRQFRIRAAQNNGIVVTSYKDSYQLASGDYVVRPPDVPLYQVETCTPGAQEYCVRELRAGEVNGRGGQ